MDAGATVDLPIENQLHKRLLNFVLSCASSNTIIVRLYYGLACNGSQSVSFGRAIWKGQANFFKIKYKLILITFLNGCKTASNGII